MTLMTMNRRILTMALAMFLLAACGGETATTSTVPTTTTVPVEGTSVPDTTSAPDTTNPDTTSTAPTAPPNASVTVSGDQEHRTSQDGETVHCEGGGEVDVLNDDVPVTGNCSDVELRVDGASLVVDASDDLDVDGSDNTVQAGQVGDLDIEGNNNVVTLESVRDIDVEGNDNTVTYGSGDPEIDDEGTGNTITSG